MIDVSQFANVTALAVLVAIIIQLVKPTIRPALIPLVAVITGVVLATLIGWILLGTYSNASEVASYVLGGFFAGLIAVGGYEASIDKLKLR